jgi:hypothetical protein
MSILTKNDYFCCDFCQAKFNDKSNFLRHIKTNKKCLSSRPNIVFSCVWCNEEFISNIYLEKHSTKCKVNKDTAYVLLLEKCKEKDKEIEKLEKEKDKQLEEKDKMIKDLQDKIYAIANTTKTVNNSNTYNVTLKCGRPLILSKKRFLNLLKKTCDETYIKQGEIGTAKWFMEYACRNDKNEVSLECTDYRRGVLKYISKDGDVKQITSKYLKYFMTDCLFEFSKTKQCKAIRDDIASMCEEKQDFEYSQKYLQFMDPGRKFINYILEKTYNKYIEGEEYDYEDEDDEDEDEDDYEDDKELTTTPLREDKNPFIYRVKNSDYDKLYN